MRFRMRWPTRSSGIMIRTRIGLNVYGTNTELEKLKLGPCSAGNAGIVRVLVRTLPREYTLTVASHDPDGVWHDWLEDAVAFSVTIPLHRRNGQSEGWVTGRARLNCRLTFSFSTR